VEAKNHCTTDHIGPVMELSEKSRVFEKYGTSGQAQAIAVL
jgi:hypothetical protein